MERLTKGRQKQWDFSASLTLSTKFLVGLVLYKVKIFPQKCCGEISQQRKQRKCIIGTAQVFGRVAKPIREQTSYVYLPKTIMGCLTVVRVTKPIYYDETNFTFKRYIRTYIFAHRPEIRDSFDTYLKVKKMSEIGFKSDLERSVANGQDVNIINNMDLKK